MFSASLSFSARDKNMNTAIPPTLAPYLRECLNTRSLALLTSVLDTPTNWLVVRLLLSTLAGNGKALLTTPGTAAQTPEYKAILISIWRSLDIWNEIAKKCVSHMNQGLKTNERLIDNLRG